MPSARPRALLLDADGTLWDTRAAMEAGAAAGLVAVWGDVPAGVVEQAATQFRTDPLGAFRRFVAGELTFAQMRRIRLQQASHSAGLPWREDAPTAYEAAYDAAFSAALQAYPDVEGLLAWCVDAGVAVRVLTNSAQAYTITKAESVGLGSLADAVCSRDCLGIGKPDPAPFLHACERLGVDPGDALYVGDEWTADALGAADAGLASAWLVRDDGDPAGEVVATDDRRAAAQARGIPILSTLRDVPGLLAPRQSV